MKTYREKNTIDETYTIKEFKEKLEDYRIEDFSMDGYEPLEVVKMKMRA